ncbi:hypothetical protein NLC93_06930, partial [Candidatus Aminicenantes bacterium AC-335-G13]|nr:hypothetical protein [Candidatus Aminicenantes bacterium AC-335-G13]
CKKKEDVGVYLEISFSDTPLTDRLYTDMIYHWKTKENFKGFDKDYKIYVHFWDKNEKILFQDDHYPPVPTSTWIKGKEVKYSRKIYIPSFIDEFDPEFKGEETLKLSIGFYNPDNKQDKFNVFNKKLTVYPPPIDTPEIIYEDGWYNKEINPDAQIKEWRWTAKEATCIIDNPRRDALLVIKGGVNKEVLPDQRVIIKINDKVIADFIPESGIFEKFIKVKKEILGNNDIFKLIIATDKTFIPAKVYPSSNDERELGIQVSFLYFR